MITFQHSYDVLVCGAGVAGIAAALETARAGLKTALVEKTILPGGLATTGLIDIYLPLCDGHGTQVTFGIAEELLHRSLQYGPGKIPAGWHASEGDTKAGRYLARFMPAAFILALDEVLLEAGVELWLDTLVCTPMLEGRRITGVEVETKEGRGQLCAACVVDATGDADVAFRAGAPCMEGDNWLSIWILHNVPADSSEASLIKGLRLGGDNAGRSAPSEAPKYHGTAAKQVTEFTLAGRTMLREYYQKIQSQKGEASRHTHFPVTLPSMAQFRTTRRILGQMTLTDGQQGRAFPDSIGLVADWRKAGSVWEIPYGTLIPKNVEGLLVAGRCIASEGDAWEVTRVIPPAALTGQAAGAAAVLAVRHETTPANLDPATIQTALQVHGIPLHLEDVYS